MSVDRSISGSPSEVLVFSVRDVLVSSCIAILLGQTKVNYVDQISFLSQTHQEVVRLHVSVNEVLGMDVLNPADLKWNWSVSRMHKHMELEHFSANPQLLT